ncbi:MAG: fatty acid cis/trans isomerase [Proteobacteria bacterium]|nr:fatty acid cis/trans isomerase [Pseudomonadota bacterium]
MFCPRLVFLSLLFLMTGCITQALPPVQFAPPMQKINYMKEVQPVLVKRCVVCHSCYNSPCQLKLDSFEGLERGASKKAVYNARRLQTMEPTRLFMDAHTVDQWRNKDFHSVTANTAECGQNNSILLQLLNHKKSHSIQDLDAFKPEEDALTCAQSEGELGEYLAKHPNRGMPYGFPPLTDIEFTLIAGWLAQGALGPEGEEKTRLVAVPPLDQKKIAQWETFLNQSDAKHAMTARYLYEHLFLAHIKFSTDSNIFYELVRSYTPPGAAVAVIATDLPYDKPGDAEFYYRFRKIHSTIVHKTHMVFDLSDAQYERFHELFIKPDWLLTPKLVGYDPKISANPFKAFEQIPTLSRYQFLLDNIHYIIMTFIRGPVCKGQVALNVVRDHFWLVFLDPQYDLFVQNPQFLTKYSDLLEMPLMEDNFFELFKATIKRDYRKKASEFAQKRQAYYSSHYRYQEPGAVAIWRGGKPSDSPLLTVFRHFDSASVHAGPLGNLPGTIWVMDYPLLERIYYSLVAGFNVFGHAMHQASIRVYMDELRQEGETYFIDFMPTNRRNTMMKEWYGGMDLDKVNIDYCKSDLEAGFVFKTDDPKREFIEYLVDKHFLPDTGMRFDRNYLRAGEEHPPLLEDYKKFEDYIQGFLAVTKPGTSFFTQVADHNANLAYVRIVADKEEDDVYISIVVNRWHDDVTSIFGEELRLRPEKDSAAFIEGFVGSYPNYFLEVKVDELPEFFHMLKTYNGSPQSLRLLDKFGVNRARQDFWQVYDRFQKKFDASDPVQAGLFDLNRYHYLARTAK